MLIVEEHESSAARDKGKCSETKCGHFWDKFFLPRFLFSKGYNVCDRQIEPNTSYFQVKGPIHNLTYLFLVNINEMRCPSPGQGNTQVLVRDPITASTFLHGVKKIEAYAHGIAQ